MRNLSDRDGVKLPEAFKQHGIDLDHVLDARTELVNAGAYLELHIEQGPVLESLNLPMAVVLGTFGVERHSIHFTGQAAHSGSTPMHQRRDALAGVSRLHLAVRDIANRHGGVCTVGHVSTQPGIVTAVAGDAVMTLDQRHLHAEALSAMYADAVKASQSIAAEEKIGVAWQKIWAIQPFSFHPDLIEIGEQTVQKICGQPYRMPSGPLHDAAEMCRAGVPTVMLFVQSLRGISHHHTEDTTECHLEMSACALHRLAERTIAWVIQ